MPNTSATPQYELFRLEAAAAMYHSRVITTSAGAVALLASGAITLLYVLIMWNVFNGASLIGVLMMLVGAGLYIASKHAMVKANLCYQEYLLVKYRHAVPGNQ